MEDVRTIYSHPQALGQYRRFIGEMERVPVFDTAGAASASSATPEPTSCT